MSLADDKQWAAEYILGPLTALEPSDETGPGTHFVSPVTRVDGPPGAAHFGQHRSPKGPRHRSCAETHNGYPTFPTPANFRRHSHHPGPDIVDWLDKSGALYHHEGPYDATLLARNISPANSPVAAVKGSNEKALKATPREKIRDALERHRPLDGVAEVRSGATDLLGRRLEYEEGPNLVVEEGNYKRWSGVEYLPEELKGKGEPSFTTEKARKELKSCRHRRGQSEPAPATELADLSSSLRSTVRGLKSHQHSNSAGGRPSEGLRRLFGRLPKKGSM